MGRNKTPLRLARFLEYVLGRRPDEFGLVPDSDGYVKIKDLLRAVNREEGYGYVRWSHLNEIRLTQGESPVEIAENRIRAKDRDHLPMRRTLDETEVPKILFTSVRRRAHAAVMEYGIRPGALDRVMLFAEESEAREHGRSFDPDPVVLTVHVAKSAENGVVFERFGDRIYLAGAIPPAGFTAPPLKTPPPEKKKGPPGEKRQTPTGAPPAVPPVAAGSVFPDLPDDRHIPKSLRKRKDRTDQREKNKQRRREQKEKRRR
jgi:putative RNA 2'-phosphotransferase